MSTAPVIISPEERDLLYNRILVHLSGIDGVWLAARNRDFETADRLGHEFCDELQLVMDDLGWGEHAADEPIELTSAPEVVRRVLVRLRDAIDAEPNDVHAVLAVEKNAETRAVCERLLDALEPSVGGGDSNG
jgi:hypothetical protein